MKRKSRRHKRKNKKKKADRTSTNGERPETVSKKQQKKAPLEVLIEKQKWPEITEIFHEKKIAISKVPNTEEAIRMHFNSEGDFGVATRSLQQRMVPYYMYALEQEKTTKIVIKGVPEYITNEEIKQKLEENQIKSIKVTRMIRKVKTEKGTTHK